MTDDRDDINQKTGAERRTAPRAELDYDLEADIEGDNVPFTGLIKDISEGGLFISTDKRHAPGDTLQIRFTFPTLNDPIEVQAVVRWYRDDYTDSAMMPGIGVQFVDLDPDVLRKINDYIKDKEVTFYEEGF